MSGWHIGDFDQLQARSRMRRLKNWIMATLFLGLLFAGYRWLDEHPQHNPMAPLDLAHPAGWATRQKLATFAGDPESCFSALGTGGVRYRRLPAVGEGKCLADQRTQIERWPAAPATVRPTGVAPSCAVGAALLLWQRDVVQPMARLHLGRDVREIEHLGSYNCRNIRGGNSASEHATGNAIDIAAFELSDGRRVTLLDHWNSPDGRSAFLRAVRDGSCNYFSTTLSPDYNAAHVDHFHLDMARRPGGWAVCQ
jgi:hypothetical protein